jgi:hypothetical protein
MENGKNTYWKYAAIVGIFILLIELILAIYVRVKDKRKPNTNKSEQVVLK